MREKKVEIVLQHGMVDMADKLDGMVVGMMNYCPEHRVMVLVMKPMGEMKTDGFCLLERVKEIEDDVLRSAPPQMILGISPQGQDKAHEN